MNRSKLTFYILGKKYGFNLQKTYKFVLESQYWTKREIELYQNKHLQAIISHAYNKVPFYRKQFDELGLKPEDILSKKDLWKLPIINKQIVTENFNDFLSADFNNRKVLKRHSGGTTGLAFEYYVDVESWAINWATKMRFFEWGGLKIGRDKLGVLAGGSLLPQDGMGIKDKVWRYLQNFYSMPITRMNPEIMKGYVEDLRNKNIKFLRGYPTSVYTLAKYMLETGNLLTLTSVFTTAEMLFDYQREAIMKAFSCAVYDGYGCGDGTGSAKECEAHNGLHISTESSILEIISDNEEVEENQEGEIVLTSLHDYAMPFIRYAPGDMAIKGGDICSCGRKLPRIKKIIGRSSDIIELSNGVILNGLSIPFEAWTKKIKRFQIVQRDKDRVEVLLIPLPSFTKKDKEQVYDIMHFHCGEGIDIIVNIVNDIPVPSSGKFRYVVSEI